MHRSRKWQMLVTFYMTQWASLWRISTTRIPSCTFLPSSSPHISHWHSTFRRHGTAMRLFSPTPYSPSPKLISCYSLPKVPRGHLMDKGSDPKMKGQRQTEWTWTNSGIPSLTLLEQPNSMGQKQTKTKLAYYRQLICCWKSKYLHAAATYTMQLNTKMLIFHPKS